MHSNDKRTFAAGLAALGLRVGLGLVFIIGGSSKLGQLLDPDRVDAILSTYLGPNGYINAFFAEYLFDGPVAPLLTPWIFLTGLSTFEAVSGAMLVVGLLVRPLALVWGLLLWTFVMALPVTTSPGVTIAVDTYTSPAMLVQARDIALSGLSFVLYNLGAGAWSVDERRSAPLESTSLDWEPLGLLLRLSVGLPLLVGGAFAGGDHIQTFAVTPWLLLVLGGALALGIGTRVLGAVVVAVLLWFIGSKVSLEATLIANLNGFKRELALLCAGVVLFYMGGGRKFSIASLRRRSRRARPASAASDALSPQEQV